MGPDQDNPSDSNQKEMPRLRSKKRKTANQDDAAVATEFTEAAASQQPEHASDDNPRKGFVLQCSDGSLGVDGPQAEILTSRSDYFRHAFSHNMQETCTEILKKPDWSLATARTIVELLCKGQCQVPEEYEAFSMAADQILLQHHIPHPVYPKQFVLPVSSVPKQGNDEKLVELVHDTKRRAHGFFQFCSLDLTGRSSSYGGDDLRYIPEEDDPSDEEGRGGGNNDNNNQNNHNDHDDDDDGGDDGGLFADDSDDEDNHDDHERVEVEHADANARGEGPPRRNGRVVARSNNESRTTTTTTKTLPNNIPDLWKQFLKQGILMVDSDQDFCMHLGEKEATSSKTNRDATRDYRVYYTTPC